MKIKVLVDGSYREYERYDPDDDDNDRIEHGDIVTEFPFLPTASSIKRNIPYISQIKWGKSDTCLVIVPDTWGGPVRISEILEDLSPYAKNPIYWKLISSGPKPKKRLQLNAHFSQPLPLP